MHCNYTFHAVLSHVFSLAFSVLVTTSEMTCPKTLYRQRCENDHLPIRRLLESQLALDSRAVTARLAGLSSMDVIAVAPSLLVCRFNLLGYSGCSDIIIGIMVTIFDIFKICLET